MPRMNGAELAQALHHHAAWSKIPIVVISGDLPTSRGAASSDAPAWLGKPVEHATLLGPVQQVGSPPS
ncbi:MAG: hypothetical protein JST54_35120 [Deltaproteobacteria bacterium]|nr:hypothetical protein [Deltaproteobacteria bacterium]